MLNPNAILSKGKQIPESELVLNPDGSVYHLKLFPEHIAEDVILVGDPGRVNQVVNYFDKVEYHIENREFVTKTGTYKGKRITVLSTGIGTDNIDIAINELDAAVNIDLKTRQPKENAVSLNLIRIGTSGALHADTKVDSFVVSEYGLGLEGLVYYYNHQFENDEIELQQAFAKQINWNKNLPLPYFVKGNRALIEKVGNRMTKGITATATGFFGPQGRELRIGLANDQLNEQLQNFKHNNHRITNFEMETSALYSLGSLLGHKCCTVCVVIANRAAKKYSKDYKRSVNQLIETTLNCLVE